MVRTRRDRFSNGLRVQPEFKAARDELERTYSQAGLSVSLIRESEVWARVQAIRARAYSPLAAGQEA